MLGQPVYFLTPDVVGFEFTGQLREGVTATDLVLDRDRDPAQREGGRQVRRVLRRRHREPVACPTARPSANMAPEYGATMGFFPVDDKTIEYFEGTGRTQAEIERFEAYFKAQGLFGMPRAGEIDYTQGRHARPRHRRRRAWPARSARRTGSRSASVKEQFTVAVQQAADGERLQPAGRAAADAPSRCAPRTRAATRRRREGAAHAVGRSRARRASVEEMAANKPTLAAALHEAEPALPAASAT